MLRVLFGIVILLPVIVQGQNCPTPDPPVNGHVNTTDGLTSGSVVTYTCESGYSLVGSSSRICLVDMTWNGLTPTCNRECSVLTDITHGTVDLSLGNWASSVATYICDVNYALVGQSTRKCQTTGLWSGVEPQCLFAMFPDILIVFGVLFIILIIVDIVVLVIFLYKKVYMKKRNEDEEMEDDEPVETIEEKKPQFSPFMVERPDNAVLPLPPLTHAHNRKSKQSRIAPEMNGDPEVRQSSIHPPPRNPPMGHLKVEKIDRPSFLRTPREAKTKVFGREKTFEATTFGPEKERFKPEMVLKPTVTGSFVPMPHRENKQADEHPGKDGYHTGNSDDSNHKRAPSPAEADQLSLDEFDVPEPMANSTMNKAKPASVVPTVQDV